MVCCCGHLTGEKLAQQTSASLGDGCHLPLSPHSFPSTPSLLPVCLTSSSSLFIILSLYSQLLYLMSFSLSNSLFYSFNSFLPLSFFYLIPTTPSLLPLSLFASHLHPHFLSVFLSLPNFSISCLSLYLIYFCILSLNSFLPLSFFLSDTLRLSSLLPLFLSVFIHPHCYRCNLCLRTGALLGTFLS